MPAARDIMAPRPSGDPVQPFLRRLMLLFVLTTALCVGTFLAFLAWASSTDVATHKRFVPVRPWLPLLHLPFLARCLARSQLHLCCLAAFAFAPAW